MYREYVAVTNGIMLAGETINQPIGRHRRDRIKMAVTSNGNPAVTHIRVMRKFRAHCLVSAQLETGRTHQIRVHLSHRGFPLVGDVLYGGRVRLPDHPSQALTNCLRGFHHQALHAKSLHLTHPVTEESMGWTQPPPTSFLYLVQCLAEDTGSEPVQLV